MDSMEILHLVIRLLRILMENLFHMIDPQGIKKKSKKINQYFDQKTVFNTLFAICWMLYWRHKPRFADEDDSGDDKKVHFGGV